MPAVTDLLALDATAQAARVRTGQVSAVELVEASIARIEQENPALNAVIHPRFDAARAEAERAPTGPFAGVPMLVKDLDGSLAGAPLHRGNRLLRDLGHVADHDSYLLAKLRRAGFVVVGKTNAPELGLLPTTEPLAYGATRNPWDRERSPGGSSGGSAAGVAAGMVAVAHAGDGGGSIRIPASACGLFGLKPSRGRVSLGPDEGEAWAGLVARHVLTRSVRDSAAVLDLIAGPMPGDPYSAPAPARPFRDAPQAPTGRLRVGVSTRAPGDLTPVHPACEAAALAVAAQLEALGHHVEAAAPAALDDGAMVDAFLAVMGVATAHDVDRLAAIAGRPLTADDVEPYTWAECERGRAITGPAYLAAVEQASAWTRDLAGWWHGGPGGFDLLVTPTMAQLPVRVGEVRGDDPFAALAAIPSVVFTVPFNVSGQPAASVPGPPHQGLPVGVQLVAAAGREDLLLAVAARLEEATPWATPPGT